MPAKSYRVEKGEGGYVIRMSGEWCSGWLADNHTPASGRYDKCGMVNVLRGAFVLPDDAALAEAKSLLESKGYTPEDT